MLLALVEQREGLILSGDGQTDNVKLHREVRLVLLQMLTLPELVKKRRAYFEEFYGATGEPAQTPRQKKEDPIDRSFSPLEDMAGGFQLR